MEQLDNTYPRHETRPILIPIDFYHVSCPSVPAPVSTVAFDSIQELVHVGFSSGHYRSFCVPGGCVPYISNTASFTPLLSVSPHMNGVFSLAHDCLKFIHRRGRVIWSLSANRDLSSAGLLAMIPISSSTDYLALSSTFCKLNIIHVGRGSVDRDLPVSDTPPSDIRHLCSPWSNTLIAGTSRGVLKFIDTRTWRTYSSLTVQAGGFGQVAALSLSDHLLLTTGLNTGLNVVNVLDTRTQSLLGSISVGASLLKPDPNSSTLAYAVSEHGVLSVLNTNTLSASGFVNLWDENDSLAAPLVCMDVSSSGDLVAFGDHGGNLHLWCKPLDSSTEIPAEQSDSGVAEINWYPDPLPNVNAVSDPIHVASFIHPVSFVPFDEHEVSFNHVGMPFYNKPLLSGTWPHKVFHSVRLPPPVIPQDILASARGPPNLRTAPKPQLMARNQWPYKTTRTIDPKFKSTRKLRSRSRNRMHSKDTDISSDLAALTIDDYMIHEIQYSKFGIHDFDFKFYNQTEYVGLEPSIPNSYVNNYFQALFYILPKFRSAAITHATDPTCIKELCLLCELGYLFRMLEQGSNQQMDVCRAANWCSAFAHLRESHNLNLLESASIVFPSIASTLATCARFLFDQFRRDADSLHLLNELWLQMQLSTQCTECNSKSEKLVDVFIVDLVYPTPRNPHFSFLQILQQSILNASKSSVTGEFDRVWCAQCNGYQPTVQHRLPLRLPSVLNINCNVKSGWNNDWWCSKNAHFTESVSKSSFLPTRICLSLSESGQDPTFEVLPDDAIGAEIYSLSAVVFEVNQGRAHISSHVKVTENNCSQWYLFNDFRVRPVPESHVVQFPSWKIPSIVMYRRLIDSRHPSPVNPTRHLPLNQLQWILEPKLVVPKERTRLLDDPLKAHELKEPGLMCAIDTEFVSLCEELAEFSSDGHKRVMKPRILSLARVSLIRAGFNANSVCIDEFIEQRDPVVDYITPFSGITANDLDRAISTRPLVSLKSVYRKLRSLVDAGVIFIGHSLEQDFRIINLVVPKVQVIDTSAIYHIPAAHRKLSLKFLAWAVLNEQVQLGDHDSVEDARTALALYNRYMEIRKQGESHWTDFLNRIYDIGHQHGFKPPPNINIPTSVALTRSMK